MKTRLAMGFAVFNVVLMVFFGEYFAHIESVHCFTLDLVFLSVDAIFLVMFQVAIFLYVLDVSHRFLYYLSFVSLPWFILFWFVVDFKCVQTNAFSLLAYLSHFVLIVEALCFIECENICNLWRNRIDNADALTVEQDLAQVEQDVRAVDAELATRERSSRSSKPAGAIKFGTLARFHSYDPQKICVICLEDLYTDNQVIILECSHVFHSTCVSRLETNTCPCCRSTF